MLPSTRTIWICRSAATWLSPMEAPWRWQSMATTACVFLKRRQYHLSQTQWLSTSQVSANIRSTQQNKSDKHHDCKADSEYYHIDPKTHIVSCKLKVDMPKQFPRFTDFLFERTKDDMNDKDALVQAETGDTLKYGRMKCLIQLFGARLIQHGILTEKGDILCIHCPNNFPFVISFFGAISAGGVSSPINVHEQAESLAQRMSLVEAKALVTMKDRLDEAIQSLSIMGTASHVRAIIITDISKQSEVKPFESKVPNSCKLFSWDEFLMPGDCKNGNTDTPAKDQAILPSAKENYNQDDMACLFYSSGTTGLPKGVGLSHKNLAANILQIGSSGLLTSYDQEVLLGLLPMSHIFGLNANLTHSFHSRSTIIMMQRFDPNLLLKAMKEYQPSYFQVVPSLLHFFAKNPHVTKEHLSSLVTIGCGAAPVPHLMVEWLIKRFQLKANFQEGFGLTETSPVACLLPYTSKKYGSCGGPVPGTLAAVRDPETGKFLDVRQRGEIVVKGPQVTSGYYKNPEATAESIDADGWFRTGDLGYYDDEGFLYIVDRIKDLIKVKGLPVAPAELEKQLLTHPAIADAAVIGVPNMRWGEVPRAFVIPKPGPDGKPMEIDPEEVMNTFNARVASHKHLSGGLEVVQEVPRTDTGKVLKRQLKRDYLKRLADSTGAGVGADDKDD